MKILASESGFSFASRVNNKKKKKTKKEIHTEKKCQKTKKYLQFIAFDGFLLRGLLHKVRYEDFQCCSSCKHPVRFYSR